MAGLRAPSRPWLDAVAREAVAGRSHVVATDALLLGLDDTPQSQALEQDPADLTPQVVVRPEPQLPLAPEPPARTAVRRSDVWLLAGRASLALVVVLGRRRSRRPASRRQAAAETRSARNSPGAR